MGLEAHHAVDHLGADRFQALGPVDVDLLVEARLEFDHDRHILAASYRLLQQIHQRGARTRAVDGLLDREHGRILDRLAQEGQHGIEALERLVHQCVTLADALEDRLLRTLEGHRPRRLVGREQQFGRARLRDHFAQPHHVHRAMDPVQRLGRQLEFGQQKIRQVGGAARRDFQPYRLAEVALLQPQAQRGAQVLDFFLVDREVRVTGDAELRELRHLATGEQLMQVGADHAGQGDPQLLGAADPGRQLDHALQRSRHLDDGDLVLAAEGIHPVEPDHEIQRLVGHQGERMRGVEADRHQQRLHGAVEVLADPVPLRAVALAMRDDADAVLGQRRQHLVVEDRVLPVDQRVGRGCNALEAVDRIGAGVAAAPVGLQVGCRADLEEFVQVGRHDAQVAQPLQCRNVIAMGPFEHALVEGQDAGVAVEQHQRPGHRWGTGCFHGGCASILLHPVGRGASGENAAHEPC